MPGQNASTIIALNIGLSVVRMIYIISCPIAICVHAASCMNPLLYVPKCGACNLEQKMRACPHYNTIFFR